MIKDGGWLVATEGANIGSKCMCIHECVGVIGMLMKSGKPEFGFRNENFNFFRFRHRNYIKINKCQIKLIHTFVQC